MGWGSIKKIGKKIGSVAADVGKIAGPVVDVFVPGVGTAISQGSAVLERAGLNDNTFGELDTAGNVVHGINSALRGPGGGVGGLASIGSTIFAGRTADRQYDSGQAAADQIYVNTIRGIEQSNFERATAEYEARVQAGAARDAVASRNAAARTAAASQTEANRQRALRKANRQLKKSYEASRAVIQPYADAGLAALPAHTNAVNRADALGATLFDKLQNGLPRTSMLEASLGLPLPGISGELRRKVSNYLTPEEVQVVEQEAAQETIVDAENPENTEVTIPQSFKDIKLNKKQKRQLRKATREFGREGARVAKQHFLREAQAAAGGKAVKRKLKKKLNRLASRREKEAKANTSQSNSTGLPPLPEGTRPTPRPIVGQKRSLSQAEYDALPEEEKKQYRGIQNAMLLLDENGNRIPNKTSYIPVGNLFG